MTKEENKDLAYWKANAEEDYMQVPISVLRYITELETVVKNCSIPAVVGRSEQLVCNRCKEQDKEEPTDPYCMECKIEIEQQAN